MCKISEIRNESNIKMASTYGPTKKPVADLIASSATIIIISDVTIGKAGTAHRLSFLNATAPTIENGPYSNSNEALSNNSRFRMFQAFNVIYNS